MLFKNLFLLFTLIVGTLVFGQNADFSATPTVICVGQSVQFSDLSTGATSYSWTFPDGGAGQTSTLTSPQITYNTPGTFNVSLTVSNGVTSDTEVKTAYITVLAASTATLLSSPGTDNQILCVGTLMAQLVYDVQGATGVTFSTLPGSITGSFTPSATGGGTVIFSGLPGAVGTYPFSFTTTGPNCTPVTVNANVEVGPANGLSLSSGPASQLVCINAPIVNLVFDVAGAPTTVMVTGLPPGVTGTLAGSTFTISGSPTATGIFTYTVTASGGPCASVQNSGSIAVEPGMNLASTIAATNQTLCVNTPLQNIAYNLGPTITGATATGLPAGITSPYTPGLFLITSTPSEIGFFTYTITTSGGACGPATATGTITVQEPATLAIDFPGTNTQTVCETDAIADITYTAGGGATGADVTGLPLGITGVYNAGTITISGTSSQVGTFNYTVSTTGTVCGPETLSGTLIIDAVPNLQLVSPVNSDDQQICINSPLDTIIYVISGTTTATSAIDLPTGISSILQNDSILIFGTPTVAGNFAFTVYTSGGTCPPDSAFGVIEVGPGPSVSLLSPAGSDNQVLCDNQTMDLILYSPSGAADTAYAIGLPAGVTSAYAGGVLTISGNPTQGGTFNYVVVASGGFCPNDTIFGTIQVYSPQLTLVSAGTNVQQACVFSTLDTIAYVISGGATGAAVDNLPAGATSTVQNDTLYIFGTANSAGIFDYTAYTTGTPCEADSSYGLLTIDDSSGVILVSNSGTKFQVVEQEDAIETIAYVLTGNANTAVVSGLPAGITGVFTGDTLFISGSSSTIGSFVYSVTALGGTCQANPTNGIINVIAQFDSLTIFVPNVFSPNNDQSNDTWSIQTEDAEKVELTILNRWGNVMFQSDVPNAVWDGTAENGSDVQDGVYFYKAIVFGKDGSETPMQGFFHLTR